MRLTLSDIERVFFDLESGSKSREQIAEFAGRVLRSNDDGTLLMEPQSDAPKIWEAAKYLCGVDLKESPNTYLHCIEDFIEFRTSLGIKATSTSDDV